MRQAIVIAIMSLIGCTTPERRDCLDWKSYETREEKCTAFYGQLICIEQNVVKHYCVLWEDKDNVAVTNRASR